MTIITPNVDDDDDYDYDRSSSKCSITTSNHEVVKFPAPTGILVSSSVHGNHDDGDAENVKRRNKRIFFWVLLMLMIILIVTFLCLAFYDGASRNDPEDFVTYHEHQAILGLCTVELIRSSNTGYQACKDACAVASCCHTSDITKNCYYTYQDTCKHLFACNLLKVTTTNDSYYDDEETIFTTSSVHNRTNTSLEIVVPLRNPILLHHHLMKILFGMLAILQMPWVCMALRRQWNNVTIFVKMPNVVFQPLARYIQNCTAMAPPATMTTAMRSCQKCRMCEYIYYEPVGGVVDYYYDCNTEPEYLEPVTSGPIYDACEPLKIEEDDVAKLICVQLCTNFQCCFIHVSDIGVCENDRSCQTSGAPCEILYNSSYVRPTADPAINDSTNSTDNEVIMPVTEEDECTNTMNLSSSNNNNETTIVKKNYEN